MLIVSAAFAAGALKYYKWWGHDGPGSAFLPFWLGVVMACLAALMLFRSSKEQLAEWMPKGEAGKRVLVVLGVTAAWLGGALPALGALPAPGAAPLGATVAVVPFLAELARRGVKAAAFEGVPVG